MKKDIIISIHGILTDAIKKDNWQDVFKDWVESNYDEELSQNILEYHNFSFGYLTPVRSWIRRWLVPMLEKMGLSHLPDEWAITKFKKFLLKVKQENPGARVHLISHSYGTWVTVRMLRRNPNLKVQSITLTGSIISAHIRKNGIPKLLAKKQIKACFNWSSHSDTVVKISPPPFGHLGYWGFLSTDPQDRISPKERPFPLLQIFNRHSKDYDHNDYFNPGVFERFMEDIDYANGQS